MRGRRARHLVLAVSLAVALACCATPAPRVDLEAARREGRILEKPPNAVRFPAMDKMVSGPPIAWAGTTVELDRRGVLLHPGARLLAIARDARGGVTELVVDTGTSGALVAADSPMVATARIWPRAGAARSGADEAWNAVLPALAVGDLRATDVPCLVVERSSARGAPSNIFGMSLLQTLALTHETEGDRWSLQRGGAPRLPGTRVDLEGSGIPVVTLAGDDGKRVFALIDTGTPKSLHERGTPPGRYRLLDGSGRVALEIDAAAEAPWQGLTLVARPIRLWIGLDALERASWTIDFLTGVWSFPDQAGSSPGTSR